MKEWVFQPENSARLAGVTTEPDDSERSGTTAALFLSAGLVHHVGPNRMYVRLARRLAAHGVPSLRFDFSGIGDSPPRTDRISYEQSAVADVVAAMDYLEETRGWQQFVLIGLCSGARTALRAAEDSRVVGAALVNTRGGSEQLRNYLRGRAAAGKFMRLAWTEPATWLAIMRNQLHPQRVWNLFGTLAQSVCYRLGRQQRMQNEAAAFTATWNKVLARNIELLLVYSQWDPGLTFLEMTLGSSLKRHAADGRLQFHTIASADHTFTPPAARAKLFSLIEDWSRPWHSPHSVRQCNVTTHCDP